MFDHQDVGPDSLDRLQQILPTLVHHVVEPASGFQRGDALFDAVDSRQRHERQAVRGTQSRNGPASINKKHLMTLGQRQSNFMRTHEMPSSRKMLAVQKKSLAASHEMFLAF